VEDAMARNKALPDQFTASLHLHCPDQECRHEFIKEQKDLKYARTIECPRCHTLIAKDDNEILHLQAEQVRRISDAFGRRNT
jgi:hypothetical protein